MQYKKGSALEGVQVLDLGNVIAGPFTTAILADMGASVIKVEKPQGGDNARDNLPKRDGESTYFANFNRSKKGVTLDLKKGKEIFVRLIEWADVVVENFRPGVMEKLGCGYEELKKINPGIIYAAVSGFGQNGPYRNRAGYDPLAQAMSGIMSVTGYPDSAPVRAGASVADILAAQNTAIAILAALMYREKTGEGQYIDVSLLDSAILSLSSVNQVYLTDKNNIPQRRGNGYVAGAPGSAYKCVDGYVVFMALGEKAWLKLTEIMGRSDLQEMKKYRTNDSRVENYRELDAEVEKWTADKTVDEVVLILNEENLPAAPIMTIDQVYRDPHVQLREMFTKINHPKIGEVEITNQAIKMSETCPYVRCSSPLLGEHNMEVYGALGFTREEIERFAEQGVL